jgi:hypothetical protein
MDSEETKGSAWSGTGVGKIRPDNILKMSKEIWKNKRQ